MRKLSGQCLCGAVQFQFELENAVGYQCHCSVCRKATGTAYSSTLMAPAQDFVWREGLDSVSTYSTESGYSVAFCACCGSPVPNRFRDFPLYNVPLGSLDDGSDIQVVAQIYLGSRAPWEKDALVGERFDEMPSLDDMMALLHVQDV